MGGEEKVMGSTIWSVQANGDVLEEREFQNSHGYAMPAWSYLAEKYLRKPGEDDASFLGRWFLSGKCKEVWALKEDPRLERFEVIVLLTSFDHVIAKKEGFEELAAAFRKFHDEYKAKNPDNVCHYRAMANSIEKLTPDIIGVAWNASSVGEPFWDVYDDCECPKCHSVHTVEETRPYNIYKDKGHWFLFGQYGSAGKDMKGDHE
jgi:hypothetical protein